MPIEPEQDKTCEELEWYKTNLAVSQSIIHKIQEIVHESYEKDERWSDFDVLDQGVYLIKQERDRLREVNAALIQALQNVFSELEQNDAWIVQDEILPERNTKMAQARAALALAQAANDPEVNG